MQDKEYYVEGGENMDKYRINIDELHKKRLGKNTLENRIVHPSKITEAYATDVYHYTSPEGVIGILKNREIFFTDSEYLNDYEERLGINSELEKFWKEHCSEYDKDFYNLIRGFRINEYEDNDYMYIDYEFANESCRYFILSASVNSDSLSMWKYYSKNGSYDGYNINLFIPALDDEWIDRETKVAVETGLVVYNTNEKQEKIHNIVELLYDVWCTYKKSDALNNKIIKEYRQGISYASVFFKNECFSTEKEMRFVAIVPKSILKDIYYERVDGTRVKMYDFRSVNGVITPYIKMPLFGWNTEENWITSQIVVGPCVNYELREKGIRQFIESLDYRLHELKIVKSKVPVRY